MTKLLIGLVVGLAIGALITFFVIRQATVKKIGNFIDSLTSSEETIRQFFMRYLSEKELGNYVRDLKDRLSSKIFARISDPSMSNCVSLKSLDTPAQKRPHRTYSVRIVSVLKIIVFLQRKILRWK